MALTDCGQEAVALLTGRMRGATAPLCDCHHEPMCWKRERNRKPGGYWTCRIRKRETDAAYQRARYDRDPFWRITKNLKNAARHRANTIARRKQRQAT